MERQIQDLKASVFDMIGKMKTDQTYAAVVKCAELFEMPRRYKSHWIRLHRSEKFENCPRYFISG